MTNLLDNPATLYQALLDKDRSYDGHVFVCVITTGIFCRLSCPARKPKRENVFFCASIAACLMQGYRPCRICHPLAVGNDRDPVYADLMARLEKAPTHIWSEDELQQNGFDPSTVRRVFKRKIGMTFLELARLRRKSLGVAVLAQGQPVIEAQLTAGYESGSGFREAIQHLIGNPPKELKGRELLKASWINTPIGDMLAISDQHVLHLLEFFDRKGLPTELKRLQKTAHSSIIFSRSPIIDRLEHELYDYFSGQSCRFDIPLAKIKAGFAPFVWQALLQIPAGETRSYSDLARTINRPTAIRAVARANGENQFAIIVPCHRVIGADGSLTGYAGGLWRKDWLLRHEKKCFA
ncbi:trifunctional transcriptional activator/DNA repair protein Ada/methylated-DNA--[protein]-cysteine S-methyltransferase [uncultured Bartonella sp.]|uniref:bifunctional transcriptional activator/DNA repair enzyme AdaA n=1 Tax=uncultured Bartonella sp. TaxID=104108 RepID=UPI00260F6B64|nr:trifunctional transcriptional activator/DNA repair protein Ada/methylated-DNA--[protein]-cysteine S-methyltransferase [uncultured Bartonella sp.]